MPGWKGQALRRRVDPLPPCGAARTRSYVSTTWFWATLTSRSASQQRRTCVSIGLLLPSTNVHTTRKSTISTMTDMAMMVLDPFTVLHPFHTATHAGEVSSPGGAHPEALAEPGLVGRQCAKRWPLQLAPPPLASAIIYRSANSSSRLTCCQSE